MVIRNETFLDSICISADVYDLDSRMYKREEMGISLVERPMTDEEWFRYGPQPLTPLGALATLLVVQGVLPIDDAANAVGVSPDQLVTEAQGWAAAQPQ